MMCVRKFLERASDQRYIAAMYSSTVSSGQAALYKSTDGFSWSVLKTIMNGSSYTAGTLETKDFIVRDDGKFIVYCVTGHNTRTRKIIAFVSDTTDPTGTWSLAAGYTAGVIINTTSYLDQKYSIKTYRVGDTYFHLVTIYVSNNTINPETSREGGYFSGFRLFTSRDGLAMTELDTLWAERGTYPTDWDSGLMQPGIDVYRFGDDWRIPYFGGNVLHDAATKPFSLGFLTVPFRRIGQVASTGSFVTDEITTSDALLINCNAVGGGIEVELLDPSDDSVLTGYAQSDCDDIAVNQYEHVVKWAGASQLPEGNFKIKFYMTDAIIYSYSICEWQ